MGIQGQEQRPCDAIGSHGRRGLGGKGVPVAHGQVRLGRDTGRGHGRDHRLHLGG
jgi:hypothetical protein